MKTYKVYTYYYPNGVNNNSSRPACLAYTQYSAASSDRQVYLVEAESGTKAKAIARKLRREQEEAT